MEGTLIVLVLVSLLVLFVLYKTAVVVPQQSAYVVERLGRYHATLNAGFHILVPFVDVIRYQHSLKEQAMDIPAQVCITRDNTQLSVDGIIYFRVMEAEKAAYQVASLDLALSTLAMTNIRAVIGELELDAALSSRERINTQLLTILDGATEP